MFPLPQYVEEQREDHAEKDRGCERQIEGCVPAAVDDVSGQTADRQIRSAQEGECEPHDDQ